MNAPSSLQGVSLQALAYSHGTPLYVYDAAKITEKYQLLSGAFAGMPVRLQYAAKALTNIHILRLMRSLGAGLDTVSIQEVQLGLLAGYLPHEIIFTPNCVSFDEIRQAVEFGVVVNVDSISVLEQFGHEYGNSVPCCIRFNPHITAGGNNNIQTGHIDSKFGISVFQKRHVQRIIKAHNIRVEGLHVHTGSDILDATAWLQSADIMFEIAKEFPGLRFIDFGSGFKVAYKENDVTTDVVELGKQLAVAYDEFVQDYGSRVEIWFEPGKFLVSESGYFLVRANVIKPTPATVFVGVDSGQNHLIRPMFYGSYHQISNISNPEGTPRIYTVVGNICETDTFGSDRKIAEVREGDVLAIHNGGAYGYSMANNYNARFRPAEVLVENGEARLIRRRETLEDLLATMV